MTAPREHNCQIKNFWNWQDDLCRAVLTTKQAREELLYHEARITKQGRLLDLVCRRIGPGVSEMRIKATP